MDDTGKMARLKNVANDLREPLSSCFELEENIIARRAAERGTSDTFPLSVFDVFHFAAVSPPSDFEAPKNTWGGLLPALQPVEPRNQENQMGSMHRNDPLRKCTIRPKGI